MSPSPFILIAVAVGALAGGLAVFAFAPIARRGWRAAKLTRVAQAVPVSPPIPAGPVAEIESLRAEVDALTKRVVIAEARADLAERRSDESAKSLGELQYRLALAEARLASSESRTAEAEKRAAEFRTELIKVGEMFNSARKEYQRECDELVLIIRGLMDQIGQLGGSVPQSLQDRFADPDRRQ